MGSSRLPGKVLMPLGARPVFAHVLSRAARAEGVDAVCLATSDLPADDPVAEAARALGFPVFRGSESDLLSRFGGAAAMTGADIIVRITCDCPLIDPNVIAQAVRELTARKADYVAQEWSAWPQGVGCEVFTRAMLDRAGDEATEAYDREHVTPWIRNRIATAKYIMPGPGGAVAEQRWLLDYPEDYAFLEKLLLLFPEGIAPDSWEAIWGILRSHPQVFALNHHLREVPPPK